MSGHHYLGRDFYYTCFTLKFEEHWGINFAISNSRGFWRGFGRWASLGISAIYRGNYLTECHIITTDQQIIEKFRKGFQITGEITLDEIKQIIVASDLNVISYKEVVPKLSSGFAIEIEVNKNSISPSFSNSNNNNGYFFQQN
eukprot:TRINITY_DN2045_c1_g1_i1.p1 TRINITY_DN2045_c1_g1~~TRINITY_DN2045_c1_g1_i1.p1  ORF type:complete len:143 (-),score=62.29 TRINITY_DN2045_c1_g1_i1:96-524(-)